MLDSKLEINRVKNTKQNAINDLLKNITNRTKKTQMQHYFYNNR